MSRPICPRCQSQGYHDEGCTQPMQDDLDTLNEYVETLEHRIEALEKLHYDEVDDFKPFRWHDVFECVGAPKHSYIACSCACHEKD